MIQECQYDESVCAYSDDGSIELNISYPSLPDLTEDQISDALFWHKFRDGQSASLMLVSGEGGSGKGVFMNMLAWKFKRYYPDCKTILDYMPRRPMGVYHLFNQDFIVDQVDRMAKIAKGECANPESFRQKVNSWVSSSGEVFLKNSIQCYDEYRRYHNKRRPHNPMGILLTDMYNIGRHMDTLIVGATVKPGELDEKSCMPHVKYHVKMQKDTRTDMVFIATINWVRWSVIEGMFVPYGKYSFPIDAGKPRPELGYKPEDKEVRRQTFNPDSDYYSWVDLFNSKNSIALGIPKSMRREQ